MRRGSTVFTLVLTLACTGVAQGQAQDAAERSGFWFRGNLGGGSAVFSTDDAEVSGTSGQVSLAFGKFLGDDVVVYGEIAGATISGPEFEVNGVTVSTGDDISANVFQFGIGLGYYLVPQSIFLGAAVTTAKMQLQEDNDPVAETDTGFGFSGVLGKDFVISDKWTLGLAGHVLWGRMNDQGDGPTWTSRSVGASFTFSYASDGWTR
jgi:hypothetical protein